MSQNLKFNKSLLAVVVSSALLTACGGDDTTVEPAAVTAPVNVEAPAASPVDVEVINEAPDAMMANVSGSVVHGKTRGTVAALNVDLHINGQTFSTTTDENGTYSFAELATNSDYFLVVSDTNSVMSPAYYQGTTGEAGQILKAISVFNAMTSSVTLNDVSAGNLSAATLYIAGDQFASTGLAAKGYQVNVPDVVATESNGVYTFTLPDNGQSYNISAVDMGEYHAVDGQLDSISAGDSHVEYVMSSSAAAAAEYTFNFNLTDANGDAVFAGETIEVMVAGEYYTAMSKGHGMYSVMVGVEALNSSNVVVTTTGDTMPVSMEALIADPTATFNVTVSESAIEQLEDGGEIADFSANVMSSSLVENEQYQVVIKFSHPAELISDVVDTNSKVSLTGSTWDMGQNIGRYFTAENGEKAVAGQGWHAADTMAPSVISGYSYEIAIQNNGTYETSNPLNINNYSTMVWPSEYNLALSPQEERYWYARNRAGVAYVMSGLPMSTNQYSRVEYAHDHPNYVETDPEPVVYDFETESKYAFNKAHHTVKFVVEENEEGQMVLADKVTYFATDGTEMVIDQDVVTDQGRISGYYDVEEMEMNDTLAYSWNADNTVVTITGDASMLKAGIEHSIAATALSLHDNTNIDVNESFMVKSKTQYSLADISFDDGDYIDNQTVTGYNLETANQYTADSNGIMYNEANTLIAEEQRVFLTDITANRIGNGFQYSNVYYVQGGSSANGVLAGYKNNFANHTQTAITVGKPAAIVSPIELEGYMNITSVRMMYATAGEIDPGCVGICGAVPNWDQPIFEDVAVNDLRVQFGNTQVTGAQTLTPVKAVMTDRSERFKISTDGLTALQNVYGENTKFATGFSTELNDSAQYYYELPDYTESGALWARPDGYKSPLLLSFTAEVNVMIDGVLHKETKTFNVR